MPQYQLRGVGIDNCHHNWDVDTNEYLPISVSLKRHHSCKDCGLINYLPPKTQLKTGKLIVLIKDMFEQCGIPRNQIRDYTYKIKQMKREGVSDDTIIDTIMSESYYKSGHKMHAGGNII